MGKLAKQRRFQRRKDRLHLAQLAGVIATQRAQLDHATSVQSHMERRADKAEYQLARVVQELERIATASALLKADTKVPPHVSRVAVELDSRRSLLYNASAYTSDKISDRQLEEVMQVLLCNAELRDDLPRVLHFRVVNAPGHRSFAFGYAVTHHALRLMREPQHLVEVIAREFGHAIWEQLSKK